MECKGCYNTEVSRDTCAYFEGVKQMGLDELKTAGSKVVGVKQTAKALQKKNASAVFIAADAEDRITAPIKAECENQNISLILVESMQALGKACGIHAGASAAAILAN